MKTSICRMLGIIAAIVTVALLSAIVLIHPIRAAFSQQPDMMGDMPGRGQMPGMMQQHQEQMMQMHGQGQMQTGTTTPTMPGQDAFGAIQEIVRMLEADPR